jgi:hypothetical protein
MEEVDSFRFLSMKTNKEIIDACLKSLYAIKIAEGKEKDRLLCQTIDDLLDARLNIQPEIK